MQVSVKLVKKSFEKTMGKYDHNAVVQTAMAKRLIKSLCGYGTNYDKILELGSGTGLLTKEAVEHLCFKRYYANDIVNKSRNYLDKVLPQYSFISGNAQKIKLDSPVNLIISNAMFQWFKNIDAVYLSGMLEKYGILAFSTFTCLNFQEIRKITGLSLIYKTVEQIEGELSGNFEILHIEQYSEVLKFSSPLEVLAHMKNTGVNSLSDGNWTIQDVKKFCERYMMEFPDITLTYEPVIVIARKY